MASEILRAWKYWELGTPLSLQDLNIESKLAAQPSIAGPYLRIERTALIKRRVLSLTCISHPAHELSGISSLALNIKYLAKF